MVVWLIGVLAIVLQSVIEPLAMNNIIAALKKGEGELTRVFLLICVFFFVFRLRVCYKSLCYYTKASDCLCSKCEYDVRFDSKSYVFGKRERGGGKVLNRL